jgi:putative transposase
LGKGLSRGVDNFIPPLLDRFIPPLTLVGAEFAEATADNAIELMKAALNRYGWLAPIREVLTDRGTQFYANKKDRYGNGDSRFDTFLQDNGIRHILSRVNHPQTNGKFEKWNDTYEKNRFRFENFDKFEDWYNTVRFHESLDADRIVQTPQNAFWNRLPIESKFRLVMDRLEQEMLCP